MRQQRPLWEQQLTGLPVGIVTVAINAPLFIWAWKKLGKRFVGLTLLCMLTSSLLIDLLAHFPYTVTEEPMLAAVYGGLVSGAGYGLCYTSGATAGGTDIPSRMLRRKYPHINMTTFILSFNLVIIVTFAFVFHRFDSCMYTLICMYITNKIESLALPLLANPLPSSLGGRRSLSGSLGERKVRTPSGSMPRRRRGGAGPKLRVTESVTENIPPGGFQWKQPGKGEKAG